MNKEDLEIYILATEMVESGHIRESQIDSFIEVKTKEKEEKLLAKEQLNIIKNNNEKGGLK